MPRTDPSPRHSRGLNRFATGWVSASAALCGRVAVLAPHLDDAALSLGATIPAAVRSGADVRVVTVFAGDRDSTVAASWWDERGGFATLGRAAEARQSEDAEACRTLGATPVWLPFADATYGQEVSDEELWNAVRPSLADADLVLAPGFPLMHEDHVRVCRLARARVDKDRLGFYVEQPYAAWLRSGSSSRRPAVDEIDRLEGTWRRVRSGPVHWAAKRRAVRAYGSQLASLKQPLADVTKYELARGGETIALPT
jgi:LmbE family N-acetylglucosaminyl deacetylase